LLPSEPFKLIFFTLQTLTLNPVSFTLQFHQFSLFPFNFLSFSTKFFAHFLDALFFYPTTPFHFPFPSFIFFASLSVTLPASMLFFTLPLLFTDLRKSHHTWF